MKVLTNFKSYYAFDRTKFKIQGINFIEYIPNV